MPSLEKKGGRRSARSCLAAERRAKREEECAPREQPPLDLGASARWLVARKRKGRPRQRVQNWRGPRSRHGRRSDWGSRKGNGGRSLFSGLRRDLRCNAVFPIASLDASAAAFIEKDDGPNCRDADEALPLSNDDIRRGLAEIGGYQGKGDLLAAKLVEDAEHTLMI